MKKIEEKRFIEEIKARQKQGYGTVEIENHFVANTNQINRSQFYRLLRKIKEPEQQVISNIMEKLEEKTLKDIENGKILMKTKIQRISDIEGEIDELLKFVKQGFIKRKVMIDGKLHEKTELLLSQELGRLHQIIDSKRAELSKLNGDYAPTKSEVKNVESLEQKAPVINVANDRYSTTARGQHSTDKH